MCMISKCNMITVKGYFVMAVTGAKIAFSSCERFSC